MERDGAVYVMASGFHGTIYTGVTSNLLQRVHQHRQGTLGGFTARYGCKRLVGFETGGSMEGRSGARSRSRTGRGHGRWR